jgi:CubicO group peptidase (beta-lactamase class C family)
LLVFLQNTHMKKIILFFLILLSTFYKLYAQQHKIANASVDSFIRQNMKDHDIPGMAVAVVYKGSVIKISAYGTANLEWQLPVTIHSSFQIASTTKLLTSTIIMKCIYEKKLAINDPIEKYVDSIPDNWKGMKIQHLLNHSSGVKTYKYEGYAPLDKVVRDLKDSTLVYPFGTDQMYASGDYILIRFILERIYKKPFEDILKEVISIPAGMNDGGFDMEKTVSQWMETVQVNQKVPTYYGPKGQKVPYKFIYPAYTYPAGGYFASVDDLSKWAIALDKGIYFPRQIESALAYQRDSIGNKLSSFSAVGWGIDEHKGILFGGHSGGPALGDVIRFPNEGYTFIVLCNDGEALPYFANAIATFYINRLPFTRKMEKFKRTKGL